MANGVGPSFTGSIMKEKMQLIPGGSIVLVLKIYLEVKGVDGGPLGGS